MSNENMVYHLTYKKKKKKQTTDTCYNMAEPQTYTK